MKWKSLAAGLIFPLILALPKPADGQVSRDPYAEYGNQGGNIGYAAKAFKGDNGDQGVLSGVKLGYWIGGDKARAAANSELTWKNEGDFHAKAFTVSGDVYIKLADIGDRKRTRVELYFGPELTSLTKTDVNDLGEETRQHTRALGIGGGLQISRQVAEHLRIYMSAGYQYEIESTRYVEDSHNKPYEPTSLSNTVFSLGLQWGWDVRDTQRVGSRYNKRSKDAPIRDPFTQP